jgi:hypothetical protein
MFIQGSGNVVSQQKTVSDFHSINSKGTCKIKLTQGNEESLVIEAEDNILPYVQTEVSNGVLYITFENNNCHIYPTKSINLYITMKNIEAIRTSGSCQLNSTNVTFEELKIKTTGSSNINIESLVAKKLIINSQGSTIINITGQTEKQELDLKGSSEYLASNLDSQTPIVDISGSGEATVLVQKLLQVKISGMGKLDYYGSPNVNQTISGLGRVNKLETYVV